MVADVRRERMWQSEQVPVASWNRRIGPVGREQDLAALAGVLEGPGELLTLVGPGGIGKTTLAVELANEVARRRGARAVLVDLEGASTRAELCDRVLGSCGATAGEAGAAIDALGPVVLVLDDFDALVASSALTVAEWLQHCAELAVIVTSRERLGLDGERVYEVGPIDAAASSTLLVESARRAAIGFALRAEDGPAIFEIVALLEGVPLALELAAARLPLVGARALADELRGGLPLERRTRGGPERHVSLAAAWRGSWDALSAPERDVLAQLTVFRGGFTVDAGAGSRSPPRKRPCRRPRCPARTLARARSRSRRSPLRPLRTHPRARRRSAPCVDTIGGGAARRVVRRGGRTERPPRSTTDGGARTWLFAERENVLEVARRIVASGGIPGTAEAEMALRALVAAKEVLLARGPAAELAELVSPIVDRTRNSGADPKLSARVMLLRGALRRERGDVRAALKDLLAADSVARALGDDLLCADASLEIGRTVRDGGELDAARHSFERAARAFADAGARVREAEAVALAGAVAGERGELSTARMLAERAVAMAGDDRLVGAELWLVLGRACAEMGDLPSARRAAGEAERRARDDGDLATTGRARILQALVLHAGGDLEAASGELVIARDTFSASGLAVDAAIARGHLGVIAREQGRAAAAYAELSEARDTALRGRRPAHGAYFGAHLAAIEAALGRHEAAAHLVEQLAPAREAARWWPFSSDEVIAMERGRQATGTSLLARIFARGAARPTAPPPSDDALVVGAGGAWFRPPRGARVGLERRRSLALLLDHLATARIERPGTTIKTSALFATAWAGEKAIASAAAHRVRVAVATLRKMGLRDALVTTPDGYGLSVDTEVVRA